MTAKVLDEGQKYGLDVFKRFLVAFGPAQCDCTFCGCDDGYGQFIGALIGAVLVLHVRIVFPLAIALAITMLVALTSYVAGRSDPVWTRVEG